MARPLNPDARNLVEEFFAAENKRLLEKLREKEERADRLQDLREALGVEDEDLLNHLLDLGIDSESALALTLVPLAMVAWSDGGVSEKEREAILKAAEEQGVHSRSDARDLLRSWLAEQPGERMIDAWKVYARTIWTDLDADERETMRDRILGNATRVAEASGGFLGLTSGISATEKETLEELEEVLS